MRKTGDPMLQFIGNNRGMIGLTFTDIGLMIATGILLISLYHLFFSDNFEEKDIMENIAEKIIINLQEADTASFDYIKTLDIQDIRYKISISPEYITIYNERKKIRENILPSLWIRDNNDNWTNGTELHIFLYEKFGDKGTIEDPIQNRILVKRYLTEEWNVSYERFLEKPFIIDLSKPIFIEKTFLYYDTNNDGIWMKGEEKQGFLMFYQI